jgi:transcriptional regulator with XRE-family HTH domain
MAAMPQLSTPELQHPPTVAEIAAAVRQARLDQQRRLSQQALAQAVGVDVRTIKRIEAGSMSPTAAILLGIAFVVGAAVFWKHLARIVNGTAMAL